ncbi:zona pellucida-binding protein 2 isoform X2 [Engystomops pustulosus]|uniref:zona pellucida-binding protein 2 isoform X2 n=1 Tax=Engystomops pustulosus TaxID=76066 RepID=UPI003AFA1479
MYSAVHYAGRHYVTRLHHERQLPAVQANTSENDLAPLVTKPFIYGDLLQNVTVYVKMLKDSPFLACMDLDIAYKKIIDPTFFWVGPDGRDLRGHSNVNLTETGKLMLKAFNISMSGSYSCNLIYKSIENDVTQEKKMNKYYEFAVLAYLEPDYMYQINARFTALPCSDLANARFALTLLSMIGEVITGLNCHLKNKYHKCHVTKAPKHSLQHELFVAFKVSPFSRGWDKECSISSYYCQKETNIRMEKAKTFIVEFFRMQSLVLKEEFVNIPEINYIEHSLDIIRVDICRPGFGKNEVTHRDCPGCCVVCDPGTYSSDSSTRCEVCKDIEITSYGATDC